MNGVALLGFSGYYWWWADDVGGGDGVVHGPQAACLPACLPNLPTFACLSACACILAALCPMPFLSLSPSLDLGPLGIAGVTMMEGVRDDLKEIY
jgi:hypothetical protein